MKDGNTRERAAEKGLLVPASSTGSQHKKNTHLKGIGSGI